MILKEISNTSIAISLFRYFCKWFSHLRQGLSSAYQDSQIKKLREKIKIYFRYSILGRATEITQTTPRVLDSSQTVQYLISFYRRWKDKVTCKLKNSQTIKLTKDTKEELYFSPLRIIGIVLVTTVAVNVLLSLVLRKQISLWGWLVRGLFLIAGGWGLFCQADWPTLKRNSAILRKIGIS